MKRLFIINPNSGKKGRAQKLKAVIKKHFGADDIDIELTRRKGHGKELAVKALAKGYEQIIVCGGDGTINEAAQALAHTKTALGVIPLGSGNGLAREIGMPLDNFDAACNTIAAARAVRCDLGKANGEYFVNLAGMGIEADIAADFDSHGTRGKWPYFKLGAQRILNYRAPLVNIDTEAPAGPQNIKMRPLTLVFSNGRQYGSGFKIAPAASFNDGLLDMVCIKRQNIAKLLVSMPNFFKQGIMPIETRDFYKITKATVNIGGEFNYHIDGEPRRGKDTLQIEIAPGAIYLIMANLL